MHSEHPERNAAIVAAYALTLTETDPPLLTKTDPLISRGIVFC
jgi:hypothetical protein